MTAKQLFLQNLKEQIEMLQKAYEFNKILPDSYFDMLTIKSTIPSEKQIPDIQQQEKVKREYGDNKKIVYNLLKAANKGLIKNHLIDLYSKNHPDVDANEAYTMVTNAITGLGNDGLVKKYKPQGARFRGNYWVLSTWYEGDKLKEEHEPEPYNKMTKMELD